MATLTVGGAFLSASLQVLFDRLASPTLQEVGSLWGIDHELNRLRRTLLKILSVIGDTEMRRIKRQSLKIWLSELKDAAYDAEDVLDEFEAEVLRQKVDSGNQVSSFLSALRPNQVLFNREISRKINSIQERLDEIAQDRDDLRLGEFENDLKPFEVLQMRESSSLVDKSRVFGRVTDRENVIDLLMLDDKNQSSKHNVSGLLIAGMAGIGKTTLMQLVYDDERINSHFQLKMWANVSEDFNVRRITREIMESASRGRHPDIVNWNMIQEKLKEEVQGKQFLLILDDVWHEDRDDWEQVLLPLTFGARGSKVVITTRNQNVAKVMDNMTLYTLEGLSLHESWLVFKRYAFVNGISDPHPKLEAIGNKIVSKIKGLPLAAKLLGSLLYSKLDEESWRIISESDTWELPLNGKDILSALRLSYQHLPAHLKQCFAYCCLFPKDNEFEKTKLVQIWMAQEFIRPQGKKRTEDIGNECFDELLSRSFFQRFEESYIMHDMNHDLAQFVSQDECFNLSDGNLHKIPTKAHHFSLISDNVNQETFRSLQRFKSLRTLLFFRKCESGFDLIPEELFMKLKYIRVLDLSCNNLKELPNSIGNLKHLRYLDISHTDITNLPETIGSIHNLQTLNLEECRLNGSPKGMRNLINLRHLKAKDEFVATIAEIGKLTSLRELLRFDVHKEEGHKIAEIKNMTELQKIHISKLENVISGDEASDIKLNQKKHLRVATLEWSYIREIAPADQELDEKVLEGLQPCPDLQELNLWDNAGAKSPSWMTSQFLCNLETIRLHNCKNWQVLPSLGQLQFLRHLEISGMNGIKKVDCEFYGDSSSSSWFPSLVELQFVDMPDWEEWFNTGENQLFPCLRELLIMSCPKLHELPHVPPTLTRLWIRKVGLRALPDVCYQELQGTSSPSPSSLTTLEISECPSLTSLREGLLRYNLGALDSLSITDCTELAYFPEGGGFPALPSLKCLTMENCPKLTPLLEDGLPSLLAYFKVGGCPDFSITCLQNLSSLYSLSISECSNLSSLPEEALCNLKALEEFTISGCKELTTLQFHGLDSLKRLTIENCPRLKKSSSPLLSSSLEYLEVNNTPEVAGLLRNLTSLMALRIHSCPQLTSFAGEEEYLEKLTSLQSLNIHDCINLQLLPEALSCLTSLERLYIQNCPRLQSLPESGLPASLTVLDIRQCTMLESRCSKHGGLDWPKIAHIPSLCLRAEIEQPYVME